MKHQTLNTNLLFKITLFFFTLTLFNCENEDVTADVNQEILVKSIYQQRMVSLTELPEIKNFINTKVSNGIFSRNSNDTNQAIFDVDNILEIIDTLNNTNYSFNFRFHDTPLGEFYNLVIGKTPSGDLKTPFVLKYKCDESQLETYIASGFKFSSFKGDVSFHKYTDFFEPDYFGKEADDTNCPPNLDDVGDPIPCDTQTLDGSSNNGGGTAGGDFSGSGSGSSGSGSGCSYLGVYVINCDGDEKNSLHPIEICGSPSGADQYDVWECQSGEQRTASSTDCLDCPSPEGAIGANSSSLIFTARVTLITILNLSDDAKDWVNNPDNDTKVLAAYNYLEANGFDGFYTPEAKTFTELAVEAFASSEFSTLIQDYRPRMSATEIVIFDNMNVVNQFVYLSAARSAEQLASENFPGMALRNTKADAFRHAYWNAQATIGLGAILTESLTSAHENQPPSYPYSHLETQMDLHNNAEGISRANFLSDGFSSLEESILDAVNNGDLRYLNNLDINGLATANSQLIPTNQ
jgi:Domain of unknown function (DUF6973)